MLAELADRGVEVPEQVTVTGFDDVPEAVQRGLTNDLAADPREGLRGGWAPARFRGRCPDRRRAVDLGNPVGRTCYLGAAGAQG